MESSALQVPATSSFASGRSGTVDIGLRHAERAFRERVVPGLGRVWFVRQLSWSCAALLLYQQINNRSTTVPSPTRIAHGIEALCTKAALFCRDVSARHLGQDLLDPRHGEAHRTDWTFAHLAGGDGYVLNTHRLAASRALRQEDGLGFARGSRFDSLLLEPAGRALANAFLQQAVSETDSLGVALTRWVHGDDVLAYAPMALHAALSAHRITEMERDIVGEALLQGDDAGAIKRRRLAALLGPAPEFPDVEAVLAPALQAAGHTQQADEILAVRAFDALQNSTYAVLAAITGAMVRDGSITFAKAVQRADIAEALDEAQMGAHLFKRFAQAARIEEPSAVYFAESVARAHSADAVLRVLLQRVPQLVNLSRSKVTQGAQFHVIPQHNEGDADGDGIDIAEPDRSTFRLANFHSVLRDLSHTQGL